MKSLDCPLDGSRYTQLVPPIGTLVAEYHPDKVAHLGPELRGLAARKTLELNLAMQFIEEHVTNGKLQELWPPPVSPFPTPCNQPSGIICEGRCSL
jgi:hypothetical protein